MGVLVGASVVWGSELSLSELSCPGALPEPFSPPLPVLSSGLVIEESSPGCGLSIGVSSVSVSEMGEPPSVGSSVLSLGVVFTSEVGSGSL